MSKLEIVWRILSPTLGRFTLAIDNLYFYGIKDHITYITVI
jgi:hypothetical protein